ncbi:MAG: hypothetical protein H6822_02450 [Planctomycetaceae bacterium]|nr:hypothetical protein [Planctomycetales bacterium]MCB9921011.1 hypothetical protein [Planctomycetaceae bacterium]
MMVSQIAELDSPRKRALEEAGLDSPYPLLGTFLAGPDSLASFASDQPLNTEDRPVIEFRSPRLGERLNTSDLAAEMLGMLSLLQEPIHPNYITVNPTSAAKVLGAQRARWTARQGLIAKNYGSHVEAAQLFQAALAQYPADDLARHEMEVYLVAHAKQCLDRGLFNQARQVLQQAVKVNPRSIGALGSLAALEEQAGNRTEANRLWERALSVDPHDRDIRRRVANAGSTFDRY